jgi:hypothetical protein
MDVMWDDGVQRRGAFVYSARHWSGGSDLQPHSFTDSAGGSLENDEAVFGVAIRKVNRT